MFGRFSLKQLNAMPTLHVGQDADLKFDRDGTRVWLSRMTVADGEEYDNKVTVERFYEGRWIVIDEYQATDWSDYSSDHPFVRDLKID